MQQSPGFARFRLVAAITVALLVGCARSDPEQAVRARIDVLQAAVDARYAGDVEAVLAELDRRDGGAGRGRVPGGLRLHC